MTSVPGWSRLDYLRRLEELQQAEAEHAAAEARKYLHDPASWARDCIAWPAGKTLAPYQAEALDALVQHKRLAMRGPHGLGKSTSMSVLVLWFAVTRSMAAIDWKVITTASVWRQLEVYLWPEVHKWAALLRWDVIGRAAFSPRELLDLRLKLAHGAATAVASNQAERIEGAHSDHILYVMDEAKIIPPETWDAIEGALSNAGSDTNYEAYVVAMSTPGPPNGRFYAIHQRQPGYEDWSTRHVTLEEAIAAGRISREWAEQRRKQWGENSALYQGRVLGNFCADDEDSCIPLAWVEAAVERWHEWQRAGFPTFEGPEWTGVDVGRGGDSSVLARRRGPGVTLTVKNVKDTMAIADLVAAEPGRAIVDVVGVGAGVYDRLKQRGKNPVAYTGSGKSPLRDRSRQFGMFNVRSGAYWHLRELLDPEYEPTICLPPDDLLLSDLTTPKWEVTAGVPPKIKVENKDSVVERLGRSPDRGDACLIAGTLVMTELGEIPIEDVRPGMRVWTRAGLRPVLRAGKTGESLPLTRVVLADGRELLGTGNHPVWDGSSFRPLDAFTMAVNMWVCQKRPSPTEELTSPETPTAPAVTVASTTGLTEPGQRKASRLYTSRSIKPKSGQSRKAGMFTTKMATLWTIAPRTWKRSAQPSMPKDTLNWKESTTGIPTSSTCTESKSWLKRGMLRLQVASGTPSTENAHGKAVSASQEPSVSDVEFRYRPSNLTSMDAAGVPDSATSDGMIKTTSTAQTETARYAVSPSGQSDHVLSLAPVPVAQKCDGGTADVWNLEVEGMPEYFANGILVHNCAMAFYATAVHTPSQIYKPVGTMPTTSLSPLG